MAMSEIRMDFLAYKAWLNAGGGDNREEIEKLKRALPIILDEYISAKQKKYIMAYYVDRLKIVEIAERYGVNKSTVSRTIQRGINTIYQYLRFASPMCMQAPQKRGSITTRR